jgi:hypothetical protein
MNRIKAIFLTVAIALAFSGCAKQSVSDDALASDVKAKLYSDANTKQANISVAVKDGVVTLTGDAPSSDVELAAVKAANTASGVKRVDDQIKVNSAMAQLPDAGTSGPGSNPSGSQRAPASAANPYTKSAPSAGETPPSATASSQPERVPHATERATGQTIPSGTRVSVRTIDTISSAKNQVGQTFRATLDSPVSGENGVAIPAGEPVTLALTNARSAGRIKGSAELEVTLQSITYKGETYRVDTSTVSEVGKGRGKQTAIRTGIGAAAGAIIGGLAGGGKGAAIGSAAGAGAGAGYQILTHGQQVNIPSESVLVFTLQSPLTIR